MILDFDNQYSANSVREKVYTDSGSPVKIKYSPEFDKQGNLILVETGTVDLYAEIQSHKDSCLIKNILLRYAQGDVEALNRAQTAYMDITDMPKNMAEMLNLTIRAENDFNGLPVEVRAKFGHSFANWLSMAGSETWARSMGIMPENSVVEVSGIKEKVKEEEEKDA